MKITDGTEPFPGIQQHFWDVTSDGDELPDFTPDYAGAVLESTPVLLPAAEAGWRRLLLLQQFRT